MTAPHADSGRRNDLIVREVDSLGTLSPIATRLLEIASLEDVDLGELVQLLEMDPALSATLLKMCRSVDRGLGDRITTVRHAVMMLGLETVRSVVLGIEVLGLLRSEQQKRGAPSQNSFDVDGFWHNAVATASAADLIARQVKNHGLHAGEAFLGGLLHGLGRLVLHLVLPQAYDRALQVAEQRRSNSAPVERSILGLDHHTAGRRLAERWDLPPAIRDVIWFHGHAAQGVPESAHRSLVSIVTLARALCERQHLGWSGDFGPPRAIEPLARSAGLDPNKIDGLMPALVHEVAERCAILGLGEQSEPELLLGAIVEANRRLSSINAGIEREARTLRRRARVSAGISFFHDCWCPGEPIEHAASCIAASAAHLLEPTHCSVLWWSEEDGWRLMRHGRNGRAGSDEAIALDRSASHVLEALGGLDARSTPAQNVLGKTARAIGAGDAEHLLALPILCDRSLCALLLHDADVRGWNEALELEPVQAVWASALRMTQMLARSRQLEDDLAASNRELAEAQAELAECESLARLGEMTAGAAHEMNNPLAVIKGRAQLLARELRDSDLASSVEAMERAAEHLTSLITELNHLACAEGPERRDEVLAEVVSLAAQRAGERLQGAPELDLFQISGGLRIWTDRELLADALCELIVNAHEAGSTAKVRVELHDAPEVGRLYLRVVDRGRGMSERAMKHAFDPFFSEKPAGRQRGLGLARARRCVELLGGRVWLEPNREGGTIATIELERLQVVAQAA